MPDQEKTSSLKKISKMPQNVDATTVGAILPLDTAAHELETCSEGRRSRWGRPGVWNDYSPHRRTSFL